MNKSTNEFSVSIDSIDGSKFSILATSCKGEIKGEFILPFEPYEIDDFLKRLENGEFSDENLKYFGKKLYESMFDKEIKNLFESIKSDQTITMKLQFNNKALFLSKLPWETLYDGSRFLVSSGSINLVRYIDTPQDISTTTVSLPFRILLIVSRPLGSSQIDTIAEREAVCRGLQSFQNKNVIVDFLQPPTHDALVKALNAHKYDVIHFDGHGAFDEKGYLLFENEYLETHLIDAETIANTISGTGVKLIVLSACQSATIESSNMFNSVAPALIQSGVPAVVAMQFSVSVNSALKFAEHFYNSIANFESIGSAVIRGRKALFPDKKEWFTPTLYLRCVSDKFFEKCKETTKFDEKHSNGLISNYKNPYFVGREKELVKLSKFVATGNNNISVIWGCGGIGKTALAVEYIIKQMWRFSDGVIWIDLTGGKSLDSILDEIASSIIHNVINQPFTEKIQSTIELLFNKDILIVFDNFEDVDMNKEIHEFINKIPRPSKVIITSRVRPETSGWKTLELYKLTLEESISLFNQMGIDMGMKNILSEKKSIEEICRLLDGHPLALSLIVSMTLNTPIFSILEKLSKKPVNGIELALDTSFDDLDKNQQEMLKRISVFDSPFDEEALKMISEEETWEITKDELIRRSFIYFEDNLYVLHPVIRNYAYEKLDNKKKIHLLAAKYFNKIQDPFSTFDQLYYAEQWVDAAGIMYHLASPLIIRQLNELGALVERLELALDAAKKTGDTEYEFRMEGIFGNVYKQMGLYGAALKQYKKLYDYGKQKGDLHIQFEGLNLMATMYAIMGNGELAIGLLSKFNKISEDLDDNSALAMSFSVSGDIYFILSHSNEFKILGSDFNDELMEKAAINFESAIKILEEMDTLTEEDKLLYSQVLASITNVYNKLGEKDQIFEYLKKSLDIKKEINDLFGISIVLSYFAEYYEELNEYEKAIGCLRSIVELGIHIVNLYETFTRLGRLYHLIGDDEFSLNHYLLALMFSLNESLDIVRETISIIEYHLDDLLKNNGINIVLKLISLTISFLIESELFNEFSEVISRLEQKRISIMDLYSIA